MVAPIKRQSFEFGTEGVQITPANTAPGGDGINTPTITGAANAVFSYAAGQRGEMGVLVTGAATTVFSITLETPTLSPSLGIQVYFRAGAAYRPSGATPWCVGRIRNATANTAIAIMTSTGVLQIQKADGVTIQNFNNNTALPDGNYVLHLAALKGTTTSNGTITATLRKASDDTVFETYTNTATNTGTTDMQYGQCGKPTSGDDISNGVHIDEFAIATSLDEINRVSFRKLTTFDALNEGESVTSATLTANSGNGDFPDTYVGTGTATAKAAAALSGAKGIEIVSNSVNYFYTYNITSAFSAAGSMGLKISSAHAAPTGNIEFIGLRNSAGTVIAKVAMIANTKRLIAQDAAGTVLKNFNSSASLPDGNYWLHVGAVVGSSTTNGRVYVVIRNAATGAVVDSVDYTTADTGTLALTNIRIGKLNNGLDASFYADEYIVRSGSYTELPHTITAVAADVWTYRRFARFGSGGITVPTGPLQTSISLTTETNRVTVG